MYSLLFGVPPYQRAGDNVNQKFYTGIPLPAGDAGIHVDKDISSASSSQETVNYYRIWSCGCVSEDSCNDANNTISRVETILSISSDAIIEQISWREHF